ncbi:MAG: carboxypeptidase-like regulatory domain-containing protein [Lepagella sp.]
MKKLFLLMAIIIAAVAANAQTTRVITGAVIDKNGNPLPNALIEATGGAETVTTEADGSFTIEVPIWLKSLTVQYAGLSTKKVKIENTNNVIVEMKKKFIENWFVDAVYTPTFGDNTFHRLGVMGGFLGNWGAYAKVLIPFGRAIDSYVPSITVGAIKRIGQIPLYAYLGVGYSPAWDYWDHCDWALHEDGVMFDVGVLYKIGKINFGLGYSIATSFSRATNHSVQISVGYCF